MEFCIHAEKDHLCSCKNFTNLTYTCITSKQSTLPNFIQCHKLNPTELSNLKKHLDLGVWGQETRFGLVWPESLIKL